VNIGIIGVGYWGPNLVRNFLSIDSVKKLICCDIDKNRLSFIKSKFPSVDVTTDYNEMIKDKNLSAIAIATPISTHYKFVREALINGKHVLVEKPIASNSKEAEELMKLADKHNLVLMVDHTFIYTGAVRKIKEIISNGEIGNIYYFDSVRVNLGLFQHDVNVIWDLAPHDLSIMDFVFNKKPVSVSAVGVRHINGIEDIAYITVNFADSVLAHFHVNWLAPVKIRKILIGGSKKMIVYDDIYTDEKVRVYDKGVDIKTKEGIYDTLIQYRTGDMYSPKIDNSEALSLMCQHFIDCIKYSKKPITDGQAGLNVVKILEASEESIKSGGKIVKL
jgi:predicted dehydrogenase